MEIHSHDVNRHPTASSYSDTTTAAYSGCVDNYITSY